MGNKPVVAGRHFKSAAELIEDLRRRGIGVIVGISNDKTLGGIRRRQLWYPGPKYPSPVDHACVERRREEVVAYLEGSGRVENSVNVDPASDRGDSLSQPKFQTSLRMHFKAPAVAKPPKAHAGALAA
jgi:hypothetical protein